MFPGCSNRYYRISNFIFISLIFIDFSQSIYITKYCNYLLVEPSVFTLNRVSIHSVPHFPYNSQYTTFDMLLERLKKKTNLVECDANPQPSRLL